jgi:antitoxin PrlF
MLVTDKGQVTIPKHIRQAAGVAPGSEVAFSLEGRRIVMTPLASAVRDDRRAKMRVAAARVKSSMSAEFRQLGAEAIMDFLRGEEVPSIEPSRKTPRRARR